MSAPQIHVKMEELARIYRGPTYVPALRALLGPTVRLVKTKKTNLKFIKSYILLVISSEIRERLTQQMVEIIVMFFKVCSLLRLL